MVQEETFCLKCPTRKKNEMRYKKKKVVGFKRRLMFVQAKFFYT